MAMHVRVLLLEMFALGVPVKNESSVSLVMYADDLQLRRFHSNHDYGSIQNHKGHESPSFPRNFREYYLKSSKQLLSPSLSCSIPHITTTLKHAHKHVVSRKATKRIAAFTRLVVPYYMLCFVLSMVSVIVYYVTPFGELHKALFTVIIAATMLGAVVGCACEYKWSLMSRFKEILQWKNKQWKRSIDSLSATKLDLKTKVRNMEMSIGTLGCNARELEKTLESFNVLKNELEKLTSKSQQVTQVLDGLLGICDALTTLIREHAKTELMCAYYDAAVFSSLGQDTICLSSRRWRNFEARLDRKTRQVFDEGGGFEAIRDKENRVDIRDLEKVLSFVIDQRGFDDIYSMFS